MMFLTGEEIENQELGMAFDFLAVLSECRRELCSLEDSHVQELVLMLDSRKDNGPEHFALQCRLCFLKWTIRHWEKTKALIERRSISAPHCEYLIRRFAGFYRCFLEQDSTEVKDAQVFHELLKETAQGFEQIIAYDASCHEIVKKMDTYLRYSERRIDIALRKLASGQVL